MTRTREENAADLAKEESWRNSLVTVYVAVTGKATVPDDEGVQGVYSVMVEPELSDEEKAEAALDHFHDNNGIEMLEDFDISVYDAHGNLLPRAENHENGSLLPRAEYGDQLNDDNIPAAVKSAMEGNTPGP